MNLRSLLCIVFSTVILLSCGEKQSTSTLETLIPQPVTLDKHPGAFTLTEKTAFYAAPGAENIAQQFAALFKYSTGYTLPVNTLSGNTGVRDAIVLSIEEDSNATATEKEGYTLTVNDTLVTLKASAPAGIFYGLQTLRQLLPHAIERSGAGSGSWTIPAVTINDRPEYEHRGSMLDVARHFFSVEEVKHYIDLLAFYKMNRLHLHLSDDQGWRIEIKSWPKLTQVGGTTQVGGGQGGFYTQDQYKELVQYAADRYITIIPEIDMPGHTNAALASYAELNCNDTATKLYTGLEVGFSSFCTRKPITYVFLDSVIRELAALTPGAYIHIGGDESHSTKIEDYIPFMEKVQLLVKKYGKTVIGWDELAHCQLEPGTVTQYWAEAKNAALTVSKNAKLIMSPAHKIYMDMQYDSTTKLGLHWAAYIEVDSAYLWDPATIQPGVTRKDILGVEAPLWSETIQTRQDIEYLMFPRFPGYAEIAWSPSAGRSWDEYKARLGKHGQRMEAMGLNFYRSPLIKWSTNQ